MQAGHKIIYLLLQELEQLCRRVELIGYMLLSEVHHHYLNKVSEMPLCTSDVNPPNMDENIFNGPVKSFTLQGSGYETITVKVQCNVANDNK